MSNLDDISIYAELLRHLLLYFLSKTQETTIVLHTKRENSIQKTSLVDGRAHLVYKLHIDCPYNRCGTSPIPCNGFDP
ncbi:hypothetical protein Hanom_Chr08g00700111 [Helianthus anomalus]